MTDEDRQARLDSQLDPNDWRVVTAKIRLVCATHL